MNEVLTTALTVALVLSGGGGRGAYQIGVWQALNDLGVEIAAVYGTSVGAINGALIAIGDLEFAKSAWLQATFEDVMNIPDSVKKILEGKFLDLSIPEAIDAARKIISEGGIDVSPLRQKVRELLSEDKIRNSKIHYGLVAYSVSELKPYMLYIEDIPDGKLADYILSSANFPLFKREEIGGKIFIDGGVYSNIPVRMAKEKGHERIIVVDIGTHSVSDIIEYIRSFINTNILYIRPREQFGTLLTFEPDVSRKYLLEGYLDTLAAFGKVKGDSYYIFEPSDVIGELFMSMGSLERDVAGLLLGIKIDAALPPEKQYLEQVVPRLRLETLALSDDSTLICTKVLELLASFLKIDRLRIYSSKNLLQKIIESWTGNPQGLLESLYYKIRYERLFNFISFLYKNGKVETLSDPKGFDEVVRRVENVLE